PLMIEGLKQGSTVILLTKTIEPHSIEPLEDVAVFAVLGSPTMLLDKTLNLLKPGDDPLLTRRTARFLLRLNLDAKLREKRVVLVGEARHAQPRPSCGPGRRPPRPCAFPRRRAR